MTGRVPSEAAPFLRKVLRGAPAGWPVLARGAADRFLSALSYHGIMPLLHQAVRAGAVTGVPADAAAALASAYTSTAALATIWCAERRTTTGALRAVGVQPVALKGAALLGTMYNNVALRPMADLDLLVPDADLSVASRALSELGYDEMLDAAEEFSHHRKLVRQGPGGLELSVELHRRLLASPPYDQSIPIDEMMGRVRQRDVDGAQLTVLEPTDQLLHLAAHLVLQHPGGERLIWVHDIHRLVATDMDAEAWSHLAERARGMLLQRAVADGLVLASMWFGTPVPGNVLAQLTDPPPSSAEATAYERLRLRAPVGQEGARLWADVQGMSSWRQRITFAVSHLMPSPRYMREWYGLDHARELPIYYTRRALSGARHIVARRRRPRRPMVLEPPDRWMVDP